MAVLAGQLRLRVLAGPWRPSAGLVLAKVTVVVLALGMCFAGRAQPFRWMLLAGAAPALHAGVSATYRRLLMERAAALWAALEAPAAPIGRRLLAAHFFVILPATLLYLSTNYTQSGGDTWAVIPAACRLVHNGTVELSPCIDTIPADYRAWTINGLPYCVTATPSGTYSSYPSGMLTFAVPVVAIAAVVGTDLEVHAVEARAARLEKWTAAWVAAGCLGLFFLIAVRLERPKAALAVTLMLACGSVMFSTVAHALWQHGGVLFWLLSALWIEFESYGRPSTAATALQGLALGMMLPCRLSSGLFVVLFGAWVLLRSPRRAIVLTLAMLAAYAPWAAFYFHAYGNALGPSTSQFGGNNWVSPTTETLAGLLFCPARGLFVYQPWLILALVGVMMRLWRPAEESRPGLRGWSWFCLAAVISHVVLVSSWRYWWGGHCWGSRLLTEVVPLAALFCLSPVAALLRGISGRMLLAILMALAFLVHGAGVFREVCWEGRVQLETHPESLWSWSQAPFLMSSYKPPAAGQ